MTPSEYLFMVLYQCDMITEECNGMSKRTK